VNKPMIENSERGVTLNKTLAWSLLVSLISLVWYGGTTVSNLQNATNSVSKTLADMRELNALDRRNAVELEARIRQLENNASRTSAEFSALKEGLDEVKQAQRETNMLLRQLAQQGTRP
jgi:septal ring factor EnvC (AmiA/AmiB activator)